MTPFQNELLSQLSNLSVEIKQINRKLDKLLHADAPDASQKDKLSTKKPTKNDIENERRLQALKTLEKFLGKNFTQYVNLNDLNKKTKK